MSAHALLEELREHREHARRHHGHHRHGDARREELRERAVGLLEAPCAAHGVVHRGGAVEAHRELHATAVTPQARDVGVGEHRRVGVDEGARVSELDAEVEERPDVFVGEGFTARDVQEVEAADPLADRLLGDGAREVARPVA